MKSLANIHVKLFVILALLSASTPLSAMLEPDEKEEEQPQPLKRSYEDVADPFFPSPKKQIFGRATYDTTAKYVLKDPDVRLDFLKTFTGIANITSSAELDTSLNPLHELTNLRELLNNKKIEKALSFVTKAPHRYKVMTYDGNNNLVEMPDLTQFFHTLSQSFGDLRDTFPKERASAVDVLCKLSTGDYVVVEVQVAKQDFWDERSLAYLASVYGNQLQAGGHWKNLKRTVGINILGGGPQGTRHWSVDEKPIRHYMMRDESNPPHTIPSLHLIQYSLGNVNLDAEDIQRDKNLKDWLDYFKNAHMKKQTPEDVSDGLKKAYERTRLNTMPPDIQKRYAFEEKYLLENFTEHIAIVKEDALKEGEEKGRKRGGQEKAYEIARLMFQKGKSFEEIREFTGFSQQELEDLEKEES